ncbi:MAG: tol-pal system protein YbgF [Proteobacteria bacterium]|nr:tol-pal system protein YbgF [Pseudomonadota bacterium]
MKRYIFLTILAAFALTMTLVQWVFAEVPVDEAVSVTTPVEKNVSIESASSTPNSSNSMLLSRLEAAQQEIQQLQGKLEVQAHDLKLLHEQQRAFYEDLDKRLTQLSSGKDTSSLAKSKKASTEEPKSIPTADTAELDKVALSTQKKDSNKSSNGADKASYDRAYQLVKDKRYSEATVSMESFIRDFPKSEYAGNAHYWLGEMYLIQGQHDQAITELSTVVKDYPRSPKKAAAITKLGLTYYDLGKWQEAKDNFKKVKSEFPGTSSATLAIAKLKDMDKQGL